MSAQEVTVAPIDGVSSPVGSAQRIQDRVVAGLSCRWPETALLVTLSGVWILLTTQPAFQSFYFGEDFVHLGEYRLHGSDFWRGALSPVDIIFFRPIYGISILAWQLTLPVYPWLDHSRNFVVTLVNIGLLHRLTVAMQLPPFARVAAVSLFAFSKLHLTTIGYLYVLITILSLLFLLGALLAFHRYIRTNDWRLYAVGLLCCALSTFNKDYGLVVVVPAAVILVNHFWQSDHQLRGTRKIALELAPLLILVISYLAIRVIVTHAIIEPRVFYDEAFRMYEPGVRAEIMRDKLLQFVSLIGNMTLAAPQVSGAGGIGQLIASVAAGGEAVGETVDRMICGAIVGLLGISILAARHSWRAMLLPAACIIAYIGPTLLPRNIQLYYGYEALAGMSLLVGACLVGAGARMRIAWALALALVAVNGAVSNRVSYYDWQYVADSARAATPVIVRELAGREAAAVTVVTSNVALWKYALGGETNSAMLQRLSGVDDLDLKFVDYRELADDFEHLLQDDHHVLFDIDNGFRIYRPEMPPPAPRLSSITPQRTREAAGFNVQSDGQSALVVEGENLTAGTRVMVDNTALLTTYGGPQRLTALVPAELTIQAGIHHVHLDDGIGRSNSVEFVVDAGAAVATDLAGGRPPLVLRRLHPDATAPGMPFNEQPNGSAAFTLSGENILPGAQLVFEGMVLDTSYVDEHTLSALVPAELYGTAGTYRVWIEHLGQKSNELELVVQ